MGNIDQNVWEGEDEIDLTRRITGDDENEAGGIELWITDSKWKFHKNGTSDSTFTLQFDQTTTESSVHKVFWILMMI